MTANTQLLTNAARAIADKLKGKDGPFVNPQIDEALRAIALESAPQALRDYYTDDADATYTLVKTLLPSSVITVDFKKPFLGKGKTTVRIDYDGQATVKTFETDDQIVALAAVLIDVLAVKALTDARIQRTKDKLAATTAPVNTPRAKPKAPPKAKAPAAPTTEKAADTLSTDKAEEAPKPAVQKTPAKKPARVKHEVLEAGDPGTNLDRAIINEGAGNQDIQRKEKPQGSLRPTGFKPAQVGRDVSRTSGSMPPARSLPTPGAKR